MPASSDFTSKLASSTVTMASPPMSMSPGSRRSKK
jgi:hypothetical protein